jgi:hypothetical protein
VAFVPIPVQLMLAIHFLFTVWVGLKWQELCSHISFWGPQYGTAIESHLLPALGSLIWEIGSHFKCTGNRSMILADHWKSFPHSFCEDGALPLNPDAEYIF